MRIPFTDKETGARRHKTLFVTNLTWIALGALADWEVCEPVISAISSS